MSSCAGTGILPPERTSTPFSAFHSSASEGKSHRGLAPAITHAIPFTTVTILKSSRAIHPSYTIGDTFRF